MSLTLADTPVFFSCSFAAFWMASSMDRGMRMLTCTWGSAASGIYFLYTSTFALTRLSGGVKVTNNMRVAILDTETTGVTDTDRVVEVAVTLYSLEHASAIESYACILLGGDNGAESLNGIKPALLREHGLAADDVWANVLKLATDADCVAAHNASFDKKFVDRATREVGLLIEKPWVCTLEDLAWPGGRSSNSLVALALSLGLGVATAHRALADVDLISRCLTRAAEVGCDLLEMFRLGMRPKKRYVAKVAFDMNPILKENRFRWDDQRKQWWRNMPPEDAEALSFRVVQVD
jgi:DNA polymerase-3 subunit epsilon